MSVVEYVIIIIAVLTIAVSSAILAVKKMREKKNKK